MIVRPACIEDADALAALGRASFCAAFAHLYDPANLAQFLDEVHSPEAVAAEIASPEIAYRVSEDHPGARLSGFIKMRAPSPYQKLSHAANPIALQQLYTAPDRTGEGLGKALMDWGLRHARDAGHDAVQLSVWSENYGAQRFYQRFGFAKIADIGFWVGTQRDDEFLYELQLKNVAV